MKIITIISARPQFIFQAPSYKQHHELSAVAAMVINDSVKSYAYSQGLYVLYQNGVGIEVSNPVGFSPKMW